MEVGQAAWLCIRLVQDCDGGGCDVGTKEGEAVAGTEILHRFGEATEGSYGRQVDGHATADAVDHWPQQCPYCAWDSGGSEPFRQADSGELNAD